MFKAKKIGITIIESMTRAQALILVQNNSQKEIAEKYNLNETQVSHALTKKINGNFKGSKSRMPLPVEKIDQGIFEMKPFSDNEDDYGEDKNPTKQLITKEGILVFEGNESLKDEPTKYQVVARNYKSMLKKVYGQRDNHTTIR